jgi:hypothetical protein
MSTQNAKRMTTWMGSRCIGHSHGQPFRQDTAPWVQGRGRVQPRRKQRQSLGIASNGGLRRYARECYPHSTALIWLNPTPYPIASQCAYSIAVNVSPKT